MLPDIPIIFQNDEIVAVGKPIGISVHNAEDATNLLSLLEGALQIKKLFPVHRLDKETSGVQLLATTEASARKFAEQFQKNAVVKSYSGILRGQVKTSGGKWLKPLSDKAEGRTNPAGLAKDRIPCETVFQVAKVSKYFSLCHFTLVTGWQHQIRKHAAIAGHAIVGDPRYGDSKYNNRMSKIYDIERMYLHCQSIAILEHQFEMPQPNDFDTLFNDGATDSAL